MTRRDRPMFRRVAGLVLGLSAIVGASGWLAWEQARRQSDLALVGASSTSMAQSRPLALPLPPGSEPRPGEAPATQDRSGPVPPGGFPLDVLQEMWEVALQTPYKVSEKPVTPEDWFITGVFTRGTEQLVMVQRDSDPKPQFRKVGETLPGGARIVWVRPNEIGLVTPKSERIALPLQR